MQRVSIEETTDSSKEVAEHLVVYQFTTKPTKQISRPLCPDFNADH